MTYYRHVEPNWSQISGLYPRTRSKRIYIHTPLDDSLVEVRPDLTLIFKDALGRKGNLRRGHGFLIGTQNERNPRFFNFRKVEQSLLSPKEPILFSTLAQSGFDHRLTSLAVKTEDGGSRVHLYLSITNLHPTQSKTSDWYFVNVEANHDSFYVHGNEDYVPYDNVAPAWFNGMDLEHREIDSVNGYLLDQHGSIILRYDAAPLSRVDYLAQSGDFKNILKFKMELAPGELKKIHIEIYDTFIERSNRLVSIHNETVLNEETAIEQSRQIWYKALSGRASIQIPESTIQAIFDTAQTNSLQLIAEREDGSALPGQGGFNDFTVVYSWEVSIYLKVLIRLGYGDIVKKTLKYFLSTQAGSKGPEGEIVSPEGSFRAHIFWMCETGAVLGLLADYYLLTKDQNWFSEHASAILQACDWVSRERRATKVYKKDGTKVDYYGLLPKGRVHDWPDKGHFFFSDAYTWRGFHQMALALTDSGHPEASRYTAEVNDYRECIATAIKKATYLYPADEHIRWISNEVHIKPGVRAGVYAIDGPACLLDTGLIEFTDSIVPEIEYYMRTHFSMSDLFAVKLPEMEDRYLGELQEQYAGSAIDLYYVNAVERIWHRIWCLRGEREKALRYFYTTMAYSTTLDTYHVHERFSPQLQWLSPWQPNGSGNGRIIEMILNSLFIMNGNELKLLPCIPADWLNVGKRVEVSRVGTYLGELSFSVVRSSLYTIQVEIVLPEGIKELTLTLMLKDRYDIQRIQFLASENHDVEWKETFNANTLQLLNPGRELKFTVWVANSK